MTKPAEALQTPANFRDRVIIALDVPTESAARRVVDELSGQVGAFKIGLQLYAAVGPRFVASLAEAGHRIFLDLKLHDIPNTVASAAAELSKLGVWMFNVHAAGGSEMMRRTAEEVRNVSDREGIEKPLLIGVTVLTSFDQVTMNEIGVGSPVDEQVVRLAKLAAASGLDGVVASPLESRILRTEIADEAFEIVAPGIRPNSATSDDQKRVTTIREAFANGSSYVVIGRPVLAASDRSAALEAMLNN